MKKTTIAILVALMIGASFVAAYGDSGSRKYESYERVYDFTRSSNENANAAATTSYNGYPGNYPDNYYRYGNGYSSRYGVSAYPNTHSWTDSWTESYSNSVTEHLTDSIKYDRYYADYSYEPYVGWQNPAYYYGGYGYGRPSYSYKYPESSLYTSYDMYGNYHAPYSYNQYSMIYA